MYRKPTLLALLIACQAGCAPDRVDIDVPFIAVVGNEPIDCGDDGRAGQMTDLRFYISNPRVFHADGTALAVELSENGRWQGDGIALIDLENGTGSCLNGTRGQNPALRGTVADPEFRGIAFTVGVPIGLNHSDPLGAGPPLDDSTMHWHWRSGYKFLRAGLSGDDYAYWIHLGSAGCEGQIGNISQCTRPNRFDVELPDYVPGDSLLVDFAELQAAFAVTGAKESNCSSGPSEEICRQPFEVFGLDHANGRQIFPQRLIRVSSR